jgi:MoaA/NifB/PqqE/SkfB family radical SAM enzyme
MATLFRSLYERAATTRWVAGNRNLLGVRKRMREQLPAAYRRAFYNTWVISHLGVRRKHLSTPSDAFSPLTIKISPTMRCNLKCVGCFAGNYPVEEDLPFETMRSLLRQAAAMGVRAIGIIGGEPFLVRGIFDLFEECPDVGFYVATNGTQTDRRVVEALRELPNVIVVFSVDGFEETNDRFRGSGVFQKIADSMTMMREAGLAFGFSTVVNKGNRREVISEAYLDFMIGQGCLFGSFLPYIPVGSMPQYDLVCDEAEVKDYYRRLDAIGTDRALLIIKEGYSDGTFLNAGCDAAHTLHLTARGEAEPCNGIEFFTKDIHTSSLEEIFTSAYFQDIRRLHARDYRECLVINRPEAVLQVVKKHRAKETHRDALAHLERYAERGRVLI